MPSNSYPKQKWATSVPGVGQLKPSISSRPRYTQPGYGTNYGTSFSKDDQYRQKPGFSKKVLGLGVAAGFVGGAALGAGGALATYSVYHRYQAYRNMMQSKGFESYESDTNGTDTNYYSSYYERNQCLGGCPTDAHCEWGFCECNSGFEKKYGKCHSKSAEYDPVTFDLVNFDFFPCLNTAVCQSIYDINMICVENEMSGTCKCKPDMKYNEQAQECQIYINVNCTAFTYETPPSPLILDSIKNETNPHPVNFLINNTIPQEVNTTLTEKSKSIDNNQTVQNTTSRLADNLTPTIEESLSNSLLSKLDKDRATANDLTEAFCRDVDSFSFDMNTEDPRLKDRKPQNCEKIPESACGVAYDSSSCSGGWGIYLNEGGINFPYFSSYWKYRNDIDLLGVKAGCSITAFSNTEFIGKSEIFRAESIDQWWVLSEHLQYKHLDEDIESLVCMCIKN